MSLPRKLRHGRRPRYAVATALAASAALLAGCGSGSDAAGDASSYVIVIPQDFQGVDRAKYSSEASKIIGDVMHSRLLEFDITAEQGKCAQGVPPELSEQSPLVRSWSVTPDRKGIDVTLRENVKSAAGNVLTSADVAWSIDRIKAIDASAQTLWFKVGGFDEEKTITVESPTEFTLHLTEPTALAPYVLAGNSGLILDSMAVKKHTTPEDPWATKYLSNHTADFGPWTLSEFTSQQLTFVPNANYAGERGNLDSIVMRTVPEASSRIQLIQAGQAAETIGLDYSQLEQLKSAEAVNLVNCPNPAREWLGLNLNDPVLGKEKVREAISLALDRKAIQRAVYRGFAEPAIGGLAQAYGVQGNGENYQHNVERARKLLAEAGVGDGFSFELSVSNSQPGPHAETLAVLIQQQLKAVGIDIRIKPVPSAVQYRSDGKAQNMQAFLMAETPAFGNAGYSAWLTMGCDGLQNYMGYCNPELDRFADQLQSGTASDPEAVSKQLADLIADEQPAVYLIDRTTMMVRHQCVTHVPSSAFGNDYTQAQASCA